MDAYDKYTKKKSIAFKALQPCERDSHGYKKIDVHLVWYVNTDFTRKAWLVAKGNLIDVPLTTTYVSVVSIDNVRLSQMLAALNDCDI